MRVGIVGLGMASPPHAQSLIDLVDRVEVVAAFSPSKARRHAFAERWGIPGVDDLGAIFSDQTIDAVLILTPPNTHLDLVRHAAEAGKHVLLEKPLEVTLERAEQLVDIAERAGIHLAICLQHRFRPVSVALRTAIASGRLGEITGVSVRVYNWRPQSYYDEPGRGTFARDGGGVLLTQGIHTLDLMISLIGAPAEVTAHVATTKVHRMETEDIASAAIRFANGALGTIFATTEAYPGYPDAIDIFGTKGSARLNGAQLNIQFMDGSEEDLTDNSAGSGAGVDPMAFSHMYHRAVLADFLDAIEQERDPFVSGRKALQVHRLIAAMRGLTF